MAASSATSSSSVHPLTAEDLLDTADSATVNSRTRWPEAGETKSKFVVNQSLHPSLSSIPEHYALLNAKDWAACDVPTLPPSAKSGRPAEYYNAICAYAAAFVAGMRLPLHDLHAAVLRHYGLAPSQLMPNAWRYLNAFVLLCEDARVKPTVPLFLSFFVICADKGESMGRYHFKPYRYPVSPSDSGSSGRRRRRLFTGKMPHPMWKDRFFFIRGPAWMRWPCPMKWGTPSMASIEEPVLTNDTEEAIHKLVHRAGETGIDIMRFLSDRNPPVGHLQIPAAATPQRVAVKQEPNAAAVAPAAAAWAMELMRKRKSPEPITSLPPVSLPLQIGAGYNDRSTESPPAPAGVGLGHGDGEPRLTGGERSCFRERLHYFAQEAMAEFDGKEQELQMAKVKHEADVQALVAAMAQHEAALEAANTKHAADLALLKDELQKEHEAEVVQLKQKHAADLALLKDEVQKAKQAEASRYAEELQKAAQDAYDKGVRDMKKYVVESLLSGSSPPPGPGLVPQAPVDDQ